MFPPKAVARRHTTRSPAVHRGSGSVGESQSSGSDPVTLRSTARLTELPPPPPPPPLPPPPPPPLAPSSPARSVAGESCTASVSSSPPPHHYLSLVSASFHGSAMLHVFKVKFPFTVRVSGFPSPPSPQHTIRPCATSDSTHTHTHAYFPSHHPPACPGVSEDGDLQVKMHCSPGWCTVDLVFYLTGRTRER